MHSSPPPKHIIVNKRNHGITNQMKNIIQKQEQEKHKHQIIEGLIAQYRTATNAEQQQQPINKEKKKKPVMQPLKIHRKNSVQSPIRTARHCSVKPLQQRMNESIEKIMASGSLEKNIKRRHSKEMINSQGDRHISLLPIFSKFYSFQQSEEPEEMKGYSIRAEKCNNSVHNKYGDEQIFINNEEEECQ